jgi:hypothetical protein
MQRPFRDIMTVPTRQLYSYWLRVSGFAGPGTVSDHRKTRDRGVDAMIL